MELDVSDKEIKAMLARMQPYEDAKKEAVRQLGDSIGYGAMMHYAEICWREKLIATGNPPGGEFAHGPCVAFMVPCPHTIKDDHGHCDICCGSNRITKGVAKLLEQP